MNENLMGKRVELVVHLKDQYLRLRRGERGTVTGQFRDGFNVPLRVLWDNGTNWSVHYDERGYPFNRSGPHIQGALGFVPRDADSARGVNGRSSA